MTIYDKTVKGREEIASRTYQLPPRLRSLLVMIDGRHPIEEVLPKVTGLGLDASHLKALVDDGFITVVEAPVAPAPVAAAPVAPDAGTLAEQFRAAYEFYTRTIKPTLGVRGLSLQLKVEKAASVEELKALRLPYFEMAARIKGRPQALQLKKELDTIFGVAA
jgi:hypothetical protein